MFNDGPFRVTKVHDDGIHFEIEAPEWMARRVDPKFTIKAIKAITDRHPDPTKALRDSADTTDTSGGVDISSDDDQEYEITRVWARRYNRKKDRYEYKVLWAGYPASEAVHVDEHDIQDSQGRSGADTQYIQDYDARCPRGSVRTDRPADILKYIEANPKAIRQSSTAMFDPVFENGKEPAHNVPKKRGRGRPRKAAGGSGNNSTDVDGNSTAATAGTAPTTTTRSGRATRRPVTIDPKMKGKTHLAAMDVAEVAGLNGHLASLFHTNIDAFHDEVHDWRYACLLYTSPSPRDS